MKLSVGNQDDRWFNPDGTPTLFGFERLKQIMENIPNVKVSNVDPTATQTLKYNAITKQYEPG
jgi:hypothetical protein